MFATGIFLVLRACFTSRVSTILKRVEQLDIFSIIVLVFLNQWWYTKKNRIAYYAIIIELLLYHFREDRVKLCDPFSVFSPIFVKTDQIFCE